MGIILIILLILIGIALTFLLEGLCLYIATRIVYVEGTTYKKALKISTIFILIGMVVEVIIAGLLLA